MEKLLIPATEYSPIVALAQEVVCGYFHYFDLIAFSVLNSHFPVTCFQ